MKKLFAIIVAMGLCIQCISFASSETEYEYYPSGMFLTEDEMSLLNDLISQGYCFYEGSRVYYENGVKNLGTYAPKEFKMQIWVPSELALKITNKDEQSLNSMVSSGDIYTEDGIIYYSSDAIGKLSQMSIYKDDGFVYMGSNAQSIAGADQKIVTEIIRMTKYYRPTGDEIYQSLAGAHEQGAHPRINATAESFEYLNTLWQTDDFAKNCLNHLKSKANSMLFTTPVQQEVEAGSSRFVGDDVVLSRVETLTLMYKLTGEEKYAERAWEEVLCVSNYTDWNPRHYLDTAVYTEAFAYAYDRLYDWLDDEQKEIIRNSIIEKSLKVAIGVYRGGWDDEAISSLEPRSSWDTNPFNWNIHCNLGTMMGCLAICDDVDCDTLENLIKPIMGYVLRSLEVHFDEWAPDGAWQEGPGYGQATLTMDVRMLELLEKALNTTYDYDNIRGLMEAAYYMHYMQGPEGTFNYSDSDQNKTPPFNFSFYYATHLNEPELGAKRKEYIIANSYTTITPQEILWYTPQSCTGELQMTDTDKYFRRGEVAVMRSSWDDDGLYAGFLSGDNTVGHSQLDTGTYILDWNNVRWVTDLGYDQLSYTTYGDQQTYPARAEGHNTLVFDSTPYMMEENERGMLVFKEDSFEDSALGDKPYGYSVTENTNINLEKGSARIRTVPRDGNAQNKALRINCPVDGWGDYNTQALVQLHFGNTPPTTGLEISFKAMAETITQALSLGTMYGKLADGTSTYFQICRFENDGYISANGPDGMTDVAPYTLNTWYDIRMELDFINKTYKLYIDDELLAQDIAFPKEMVEPSHFRWQLSGYKGAMSLDDICFAAHPDDGENVKSVLRRYDQNKEGKALIDSFSSASSSAFAISDITDAYKNMANSVKRGVYVDKQREILVVRDEFEACEKSDVYWFSHSAISDVEMSINPDGKSLILTSKKNQSRMWVQLLTPTDAVFEIMETAPLAGSPNPEEQTKMKKFQKFGIKLEGIDEGTISVAYIPLREGSSCPEYIPEDISLSSWSANDESLADIQADIEKPYGFYDSGGMRVDEISPQCLCYKASITNRTADSKDITLIIAAYDCENMTLSKLRQQPITAIANDTTEISIDVDLLFDPGPNMVLKAFYIEDLNSLKMLDTSSLMPAASVRIIQAQ